MVGLSSWKVRTLLIMRWLGLGFVAAWGSSLISAQEKFFKDTDFKSRSGKKRHLYSSSEN